MKPDIDHYALKLHYIKFHSWLQQWSFLCWEQHHKSLHNHNVTNIVEADESTMYTDSKTYSVIQQTIYVQSKILAELCGWSFINCCTSLILLSTIYRTVCSGFCTAMVSEQYKRETLGLLNVFCSNSTNTNNSSPQSRVLRIQCCIWHFTLAAFQYFTGCSECHPA